MRVTYQIVDADGDAFDVRVLPPNCEIPVAVRSARVDENGDLTVTLEYARGTPTTTRGEVTRWSSS